MSTVPLRLRILQAMTDRFAEKLVGSGGFATDLRFVHPSDEEPRPFDPVNDDPADMRLAVFRGRTIFGDNDPETMLSLLEVPIPLDQAPAPGDSEFSNGVWELMLQGFTPDDHENPTDPAHYFMADVKKVLAQEKKKAYADEPEDGIFGLGNFITGLRIGAGVVRPPDEISAKAYFWLTVELDLVEDLSDPYED